MPMAAAPLALAATGLSVVGSLTKAQGAADGFGAQADQATRAAEIGRVKAAQTDTSMRQNLASTLGNIYAVRASANTDSDSPTQAAIINNVEGKGDANRNQAVQNINNQVNADETASQFYRNSAENAIIGGYMGAAGQIIGGLSGAAKSGAFSA